MTKTSVCALLACLVIAGSAAASPSVGVTRVNGYSSGMGGEFTLMPNQDLKDITAETGAFQSFCLEMSEYVYPPVTCSVILNDEAVQGGTNYGTPGSEGGDPLDARTAYLYSQFRAGTLAGYNYTPGAGRASSAGALQEVIWYLEDEMGMTWSAGSLQDTFYQAAQNAVSLGTWTGLGNVRILNMYALGHAGDPQYRQQDMLVTTTIPAPGAIILGVVGSGVVSWLRRRRAL